MSDLDATLDTVRQIREWRAADRTESAAIKALLDEAAAHLTRPPARNGSTNGDAAVDRAAFDQNLADVREIAVRLRNAAH